MLRAWTGLAVHLDRGPVIGTTPGQPGLWHAVTSNGYTLGPLAGRMAAEAMLIVFTRSPPNGAPLYHRAGAGNNR